MGLGDYMRLEGLGLRFVPIKTPGQKGQFGIHGNGDIDPDKIYDRIMTRFKWGGFDTHDQFVSSSFLPSYYAHKTLIERAAYSYLAEGENQKAIDLADKYFEAFPHMNFPYDARILNLLRIYEQAGAYGQSKKHIEILANETEEFLKFYQSLSREDFNKGFAEDQRTALQVIGELERLATSNADTEYLNELKSRFDVFKVAGVKG
jgi:tetratricopeptide (TPR) repeat protein